MNVDAWDAPGMGEFLKSADLALVPRVRQTDVMVLIAPGAGVVDTKFAVELGLAVMLQKPIILLLVEGRTAPAKVKRLADAVAVVPSFTREAVQRAVSGAVSRLEKNGVIK